MKLQDMSEIEVNVTQNHINRGKPDDASNCPIALALFEIMEKNNIRVEVEVVPDQVTLSNILEASNFELPESAANFVAKFDNNERVMPFKFTLKRNDYCRV